MSFFAARVDVETELTGRHVRLRPYRHEDSDALFKAVSESAAQLSRWLSWCDEDYTRADSAAWVSTRVDAWQSGREFSFGIFDRASDQFIGGCGLNHIDLVGRRANLGYWLRTSATGRGYATEAARVLARFGFERLKLERIEIVAAVGNDASQRVAELAGATRETLARKRVRVRDTQLDAVVFSLIRADLLGK